MNKKFLTNIAFIFTIGLSQSATVSTLSMDTGMYEAVGIAKDDVGYLYMGDTNGKIQRINQTTGATKLLVANSSWSGVQGCNGASGCVDYNFADRFWAIWVSPDGTTMYAGNSEFDTPNHSQSTRKERTRKYTLDGDGNVLSSEMIAEHPNNWYIGGIDVDAAGNVYVGHRQSGQMSKIKTDGSIHTLTGQTGELYEIIVTEDGSTLYTVSRWPDYQVTMFEVGSELQLIEKTRLAGGTQHNEIQDGVGTDAWLRDPYGCAMCPNGSIYFTDRNTIRKVTFDGTADMGIVENYVNPADVSGNADGPAGEATLKTPKDLVCDANNVLYVVQQYNSNVVRIVTPVVFFQPQTKAELQTAVDMWVDDNAAALSTYGEINTWDVSLITDMSELFLEKSTFNDNISNWDVSNVTDMENMFRDASNFNQDLSSWNVSSVSNMAGMLGGAYSFNQDILSWNVSNVTNMYQMFNHTTFNSDISSWDVSMVSDMGAMFYGAHNFNQDISSWDVSSVTDMYLMFGNAHNFNQDISSWDVSSVTNFSGMFDEADALSEANQCAIDNSWFVQNCGWPYDWCGNDNQDCSNCNGCNPGTECDEWVTDVNACNADDLQALENLISQNGLGEETSSTDYDNGDGTFEALEMGEQHWVNGRLTMFNAYGGGSGLFSYGLTVVPENINNLSELTYLDLDNNQLETLPESFSGLSLLETLWLGRNPLEVIPESIFDLISLNLLGVYETNLTGSIPPEIGNLINLKKLYLSNNQLSSYIPPEIGNLINLERLYLQNNQISGYITPEIGDLINLERLYLQNNQISGYISSEIGNLINLEILYLQNNQISGSIPAEISNLTNLERLKLFDNQFTGSIPTEIENLTNLVQLELMGNQLSGDIPSEIGNLTNLYSLWLRDNQLSGEIPSEIGNLTNLEQLYLSGNNLTGEIPTEIGNLINLHTLELQVNQLTGSIPSEIGNLANLEGLGLDWNQLTGSIPSEIGNLTNLQGLNFGENGLTGSIPQEIGNLTNLHYLNIGENELTGSIPSEIGNLTNLESIHLFQNQLSGQIPAEIENLTNLHYLNIGENGLTGSIPPEIENLTNLLELYLENNQLSGSIPPEIGNLANLENLKLFDNQLTGSIPTEIGNLTNLGQLELMGNQLTGDIPSEIGNLTNLYSLWLRDNQLSGEIPSEIGNLTNLEQLYLSGNQLYGGIPSEICNIESLNIIEVYNNNLCPPYPGCLSEEAIGSQNTSNCAPEVTSIDITGTSGYRFLSSPVSGAIYGDFLDELWTQGMAGSDMPESSSSNVWTWNNSWNALTDLATDNYTAGSGVLVYVFADTDFDGTDDLPVTLSVDGTQNTSPITITTNANDWNLLGNPYGFALDVNQLLTDNSVFHSTVYVWDNAATAYKTHNGQVGDLQDGLVSPFDGFWIQAGADGNSFEFTEESIVNSYDSAGRSTTFDSTGSAVFTFINGANSSSVYLSFNLQGQINLDPADASRLLPMEARSHMTSMIHESGKSLSINNLPFDLSTDISMDMDVMMLSPVEGGYTTQEQDVIMEWDLSNIPEGMVFTLIDNTTGQTIDLDALETANITLPNKGILSLESSGFMGTYPELGQSQFTLTIQAATTATDVDPVPDVFALHRAYPNPFNPSTLIGYDLPRDSHVSLEIFDLNGRSVKTLINGYFRAGKHQVAWNADQISSGIYLVRLVTGKKVFNQKITYIK